MPSLTIVIAIGVAGGVLYAALRAILAALERSGRDAERAERAQADLRVAERRSEVMAEQRTSEDAERRLVGGDF